MIKKPLLVSLAAAALLTGNAQAASMFDRMTEMEIEMKALQAELAEVKAAKAAAPAEKAEADETDEEETADNEAEDAEEADTEEEDDGEEEESVQDTLDDMEEQLTELNIRTSGNHLKFGVDFRTAVDNLQYKMADGHDEGNPGLITNRLWIDMNWAATENLSFTGQLAYYKAYGNRSYSGAAGFETFDWITNDNPYDDVVRVRSAYFFYRNDTFMGTNIPWTFSVGRRPSTNGHLINMRDDNQAASPMAHTINVEFDGLSSKFTLLEDYGTYVKLCAGRGNTNANVKFMTVDTDGSVTNNPGQVLVGAPYASGDGIPTIDMVGFIFVPYNDGQYSIGSQYTYAYNLIDAVLDNNFRYQYMESVGALHTLTANLTVSGIGNEWSDFLDDTTLFVSGAMTITDPDKDGQGMLGTHDSARGYSVWLGAQFPSLLTDDGRWGLEWNRGTKYWRPITYSEDTLIGSKIAARGDAYEAYFTEPLIEDILSFQLRYTYIDYKYAGSNFFFGSTTGTPYEISEMMASGNPMTAVTVDTAQDIRAYLRYRF